MAVDTALIIPLDMLEDGFRDRLHLSPGRHRGCILRLLSSRIVDRISCRTQNDGLLIRIDQRDHTTDESVQIHQSPLLSLGTTSKA